MYIYIYWYFQASGSCADPFFILVQLIGAPRGPHATDTASRRGPRKSSWDACGSHFWMKLMICEVSEGSRGVLGGPFEVRRVMKSLGRGREVPGRFRGVSWRGPWNPWFSFFQRWICQRSNEILMFWVRGRFVKRSVVIWLCYFLLFFEASTFAKQWGEYVIKTIVFGQFQYGIFRFQWKHDAQNMISGGDISGPCQSILKLIVVVFSTISLLNN